MELAHLRNFRFRCVCGTDDCDGVIYDLQGRRHNMGFRVQPEFVGTDEFHAMVDRYKQTLVDETGLPADLIALIEEEEEM